MADDAPILTVEQAAEHLGASVDDRELPAMIAAAIGAVEHVLARQLVGDTGIAATSAALPANVVHAVKLALTVLYDDRAAPAPEAAILSLAGRWAVVSFG